VYNDVEQDRMTRGRALTEAECRSLLADRQGSLRHGTAPIHLEIADRFRTLLDEARAGAPSSSAIETRLRAFLWLNHGHGQSLYGDDGEMQCHLCIPVYDYRRAPLDQIVAAAEAAVSPLAWKGR
jgi:hypothetical protein